MSLAAVSNRFGWRGWSLKLSAAIGAGDGLGMGRGRSGLALAAKGSGSCAPRDIEAVSDRRNDRCAEQGLTSKNLSDSGLGPGTAGAEAAASAGSPRTPRPRSSAWPGPTGCSTRGEAEPKRGLPAARIGSPASPRSRRPSRSTRRTSPISPVSRSIISLCLPRMENWSTRRTIGQPMISRTPRNAKNSMRMVHPRARDIDRSS